MKGFALVYLAVCVAIGGAAASLGMWGAVLLCAACAVWVIYWSQR